MYRILVPVDRNVERAEKQATYVTSLPAGKEEVEAKVIFVDEADYRGAPSRDLEEIEAVQRALSAIRETGIPCDAEMRDGMIAKEILATAEEFAADKIVMAGRDRSGVMKVLLGSVTQDIVLATDRPVTIVG